MNLFLLLLPSLTFAGPLESITCHFEDLPESKAEKYVVYREEGAAALLVQKRNSKGEVSSQVLVKDLECVHAKSDANVLNCIHAAPAGSSRVSDAQLTNIKHSYLSAGSVKERGLEPIDALSENYKFYFRDDRASSAKEIKKSFNLQQCRPAMPAEIDWAKRQLSGT